MSVDKISFSASRVNKRASGLPSHANSGLYGQIDQMLQEDAYVKNEKPKKGHRTIVGLGTIALLISICIAGRRGKLGPKLQKLLGGAEKAVEKNAGEIKVEDIVPTKIEEVVPKGTEVISETIQKPLEPTFITKNGKRLHMIEEIKPANFGKKIAKLEKSVQEAIEKINSKIDRNIPKVDDSFKNMKIYSKEECIDMINKEVDLKSIDFSKCCPDKNGNLVYRNEKGGYVYTVRFNPENKSIMEYKKANLENYNDAITIKFGEGKKVDYTDRKTTEYFISNAEGESITASRHISDGQTAFYHGDGSINHVTNKVCDANGKVVLEPDSTYKILNSSHVHYKNGKISEIEYFDKATGNHIKTEYIKNKKVIAEEYVIPGEPLNLKIASMQFIFDKVNWVLKLS